MSKISMNGFISWKGRYRFKVRRRRWAIIALGLTFVLGLITLASLTWSPSVRAEVRCTQWPLDATKLDLRDCGLTQLPARVLATRGLQKLDISSNALRALPDGFAALSNLEIIFMSSNQLDALPRVLASLPMLRVLALKNNLLTAIDTAALPVRSLEWLILTGNRIHALPNDNLQRLARVRKLMLSHNRIEAISNDIISLRSLEMLRISDNRLVSVPFDIFARMPRLAWVALSGNPCTNHPNERTLPVASPRRLHVGPVVGHGAGGATHQGVFGGKRVAVKIWHSSGQLSDGSADAEIAAHTRLSAALGGTSHPNIVYAIAEAHLGTDVRALVIPWVNEAVVLGAPPNFASVTRDTDNGAVANLHGEGRWVVAWGVASALAHVHAAGLAHGDVYLHNVIWDPGAKRAYLSDMGAAYAYDREMDTLHVVEGMEVRAFGLLLLDMVAWSQDPHSDNSALLRMTAEKCLALDPAKRPLFSAIVRMLRSGVSYDL